MLEKNWVKYYQLKLQTNIYVYLQYANKQENKYIYIHDFNTQVLKQKSDDDDETSHKINQPIFIYTRYFFKSKKQQPGINWVNKWKLTESVTTIAKLRRFLKVFKTLRKSKNIKMNHLMEIADESVD